MFICSSNATWLVPQNVLRLLQGLAICFVKPVTGGAYKSHSILPPLEHDNRKLQYTPLKAKTHEVSR